MLCIRLANCTSCALVPLPYLFNLQYLPIPFVQAGLAGMMGMAGSSNVQGEDQKKLDLVANEVFKNSLRRSGQCCILVSRKSCCGSSQAGKAARLSY